MFNPKYLILYADNESAMVSFGLSCKEVLRKANIAIKEIVINNSPDDPIWDSQPVAVDFTLSEFDKSSTSSVFKCRFDELRQKYSEFCHIIHWRIYTWKNSSLCICLSLWNKEL